MAFEENLKRLQTLTQKLEHEDLPLEEAVCLYNEGMQVAAACQKDLDEAKLRVSQESVLTEDMEEATNETGE